MGDRTVYTVRVGPRSFGVLAAVGVLKHGHIYLHARLARLTGTRCVPRPPPPPSTQDVFNFEKEHGRKKNFSRCTGVRVIPLKYNRLQQPRIIKRATAVPLPVYGRPVSDVLLDFLHHSVAAISPLDHLLHHVAETCNTHKRQRVARSEA